MIDSPYNTRLNTLVYKVLQEFMLIPKSFELHAYR